MAKSQSIALRDFLMLNGALVSLHSFKGGNITAEILKENQTSGRAVKKRVASVRYEDIVFETGLSDEIKEVIKKAWNGESLPMSGSHVTTDVNFKALYEDIFPELTLMEIAVPRCDGASKEAFLLRLAMRPSLIQIQKGDGRAIQGPLGRRQKTLLTSNFRFELGTLPCSRVASIDSFNILIPSTTNPVNGSGHGNRFINPIDFPDLFINISQSDFQPWLEWHKKFIVEGKNGETDELSGRLVFLAPDLREELLAISLHGVGIFSLQRNVNSAETTSRFRVGLYCERMVLESL